MKINRMLSLLLILIVAVISYSCDMGVINDESIIDEELLTAEQLELRDNMRTIAEALSFALSDEVTAKYVREVMNENVKSNQYAHFRFDEILPLKNSDQRVSHVLQSLNNFNNNTGDLESIDINDLLEFAADNNLEVYWPYQIYWEDADISEWTISYHPMTEEEQNEGFITLAGDGDIESFSYSTTTVDESYTQENPTLILYPNFNDDPSAPIIDDGYDPDAGSGSGNETVHVTLSESGRPITTPYSSPYLDFMIGEVNLDVSLQNVFYGPNKFTIITPEAWVDIDGNPQMHYSKKDFYIKRSEVRSWVNISDQLDEDWYEIQSGRQFLLYGHRKRTFGSTNVTFTLKASVVRAGIELNILAEGQKRDDRFEFTDIIRKRSPFLSRNEDGIGIGHGTRNGYTVYSQRVENKRSFPVSKISTLSYTLPATYGN